MQRQIESPQRMPRMLAFRVDGTGTASILEGQFDGALTDNGTGDYTITFTKAFVRVPVISALPLATDIALSVSAVSASSVRVLARSIGAAPAAADVDFHLQVLGFDTADQI